MDSAWILQWKVWGTWDWESLTSRFSVEMMCCRQTPLPRLPQVMCGTEECVEECCLPVCALSFSLTPYFSSVWVLLLLFVCCLIFCFYCALFRLPFFLTPIPIWFSFAPALFWFLFVKFPLHPPLSFYFSPLTLFWLFFLPSYLPFYFSLRTFCLWLFSCRLGSMVLFVNADYPGWSSMSVTPAE